MIPKDFPYTRWLTIFITAHLIAWTLVPALIRYNLPLDAMEGTTWGHQLEWGYDKNPFMNAWLTAFAVYLSPTSGWLVYLFSQISVAACFWSVWQLGKKILSPAYSLIAVLLLEGVQYYNFHAIDFNDNTLELGLWAFTLYFFYRALKVPPSSRSHYLYWIGTAIFAALGMMTKYYTAALLAAMTLFLFSRAENRRQLKTWPPYFALVIFTAIILPHMLWLFSHDFITVMYVVKRTNAVPTWFNHLFFPAQFAWQQLQVLIPALLFFAVLFIGKKPLVTENKIAVTSFDKSFLLYTGLGPFLLTLLLSLISGIKLRAGWGMPLVSLWGLILLSFIQPRLSFAKLYSFITVIFLFMATLLTGYIISLVDSSDTSSANFPGRELAQTITQEWHNTYHRKLNYVAGSRWTSGNISFYSSDHPAVYIDWNKHISFWIKENKMQENGAVFVWDITGRDDLPAEIKQKYPRLEHMQVLALPYHRNTHQLAPALVGMAFLPPQG